VAVADDRQWADTVRAWIEEAVTVSSESRYPRLDVYGGYQVWCKDNGLSAVSSKKFWPRFREVLTDKGTEYVEVTAQGDRKIAGLCSCPGTGAEGAQGAVPLFLRQT
jgi:phage/plasmid-associated DNA primase